MVLTEPLLSVGKLMTASKYTEDMSMFCKEQTLFYLFLSENYISVCMYHTNNVVSNNAMVFFIKHGLTGFTYPFSQCCVNK